LQITFPKHFAQRMAEFFEANHGLAAAIARRCEDLVGTRRVFDPMLGGKQARKEEKQSEPPHDSFIIPRARAASFSRAR